MIPAIPNTPSQLTSLWSEIPGPLNSTNTFLFRLLSLFKNIVQEFHTVYFDLIPFPTGTTLPSPLTQLCVFLKNLPNTVGAARIIVRFFKGM